MAAKVIERHQFLTSNGVFITLEFSDEYILNWTGDHIDAHITAIRNALAKEDLQ